MRRMDFEYAIKKDVRNNPIIREIDRARQRELWLSTAVGAGLVFVLLFAAWQQFELVRYGYRLEEMQQERARQEEINRYLRLEVETLQAPSRIERIATRELQMVSPPPAAAIVIERVTTAPPPAASIVAAR